MSSFAAQNDDFTHLAERLDAIAEELADKAMADLRQSIAEDGDTYGDRQKQLGKARRAVEKAAYILRGDSGW